MDKNYLDTLKRIDLRPGKVKVKENKEEVLMEQDDNEMGIHDKIKDWFRKNPNPKDSQIRDLAKEWGISEDELEEHIYMVLTNYMKKYDENITEGKDKVLHELFVQTSEIEQMPKGKDRDLQILRLSIIAELDAVNLYMRFANLAQDGNIKKVMIHVANEEKVHVGEFETMMEYLDPEFEKFEEEGEQEVADETGLDVSD